MYKKFYFINLFLLLFITCTQLQASSEVVTPKMVLLLKAIEQQDFKTLERELKKTKFTWQERRLLWNKANQIADEFDKKAWISAKNKKIILSMIFCAAAIVSLSECGEIQDFAENRLSYKVSFFDPIKLLPTKYKKRLASFFVTGVACFFAAYISERESGYYTNRPNYIRNYLYNFNFSNVDNKF
ncbi:hypothetical protein M1446_05620 [Candidatus Dependentiae bacterium]|nr:hypothetical protein [Candidatus Dependentiae bacterium]